MKGVGERAEHIPGDTQVFGADEMFLYIYYMPMHVCKPSLHFSAMTWLYKILNKQKIQKHTLSYAHIYSCTSCVRGSGAGKKGKRERKMEGTHKGDRAKKKQTKKKSVRLMMQRQN